jgi:hypothetical protein
MIRALLIPALLLTIGPGEALAGDAFVVAPAPAGNDANDCLSAQGPCATIQHASELCTAPCSIQLMNGRYLNQGLNVTYYKIVSVVGNCDDPSQVVVIKSGGAIFWAQDHSILTVRCLETQTTSNNTIGFSTRQFAIMDLDRIRHGYMPLGHHISANEKSKINCGGDNWIVPNSSGTAGATTHVSVGGQSQVIMGCGVSATTGVATFDAFASVATQSLLDASGLRWGAGRIAGRQYDVDAHSQITGVSNLPGRGHVGPKQ